MTIKKTEDKKRCVDPKFEYLIRMFSQRTGRKDYENFVVNTIWAKLLERGCEIQPITQQIVFGTSGKPLLHGSLFSGCKTCNRMRRSSP